MVIRLVSLIAGNVNAVGANRGFNVTSVPGMGRAANLRVFTRKVAQMPMRWANSRGGRRGPPTSVGTTWHRLK